MDCLEIRRQFGVKHRSLRLWAGGVIWLTILTLMGLAYYICVVQFSGRPSSSPRAFRGWHYWRTTGEQDHVDINMPSRFERPRVSVESPQQLPQHSSVAESHKLLHNGLALVRSQQWLAAIPQLERGLSVLDKPARSNTSFVDYTLVDAGMYALTRCYAETDQLELARHWTDVLYARGSMAMAEPAYYLCRRLREAGNYALALYYYLVARPLSRDVSTKPQNPYIPVEPDLYDYLLDYEGSILWSYVSNVDNLFSKMYGLDMHMQLLENPRLPSQIRDSMFINLQFYVPSLHGKIEILREERSTEEEWRYSSPTFVGGKTLIRVVNYYVSDDGSYHVSKGDKVMTRLVLADTEKEFELKLSETFASRATEGYLHHPGAYILGLEDTRAVVDASHNNTIFTLSASQEFSLSANVMSQVLGILDMQKWTLTIQAVLQGPHSDRHDKNWVFAGGLDNVVYGWYPSIEIGAIDHGRDSRLHLHTSIPSPPSFSNMRGSTNGALYRDEWWFVTHAVIYRSGQMRKYLHRLVVLDGNLTRIIRYSLPFTFERDADVEYCLGLKVEDVGMTFGYSVRDRSSRILRAGWMAVGILFL